MSKFTLTLDSTQIETALECQQKWLNHDFKHLEPMSYNQKVAMSLGTYGHRLLDIYYKGRARNANFKDLLDLCRAYNPDDDMCECGCQKDVHKHLESLGIDECSRCKKCLQFRAKPFPLDTKERLKVYKRIEEYVVKYSRQPDFKPLSENHVEVGFAHLLYEDAENKFILEGRIDLIASYQGLDQCFVDHKFQTLTHWLYPNSIQFKNYALATGITTGFINYIRTVETKTLKKDKLDDVMTRDTVNFNQIQLAAWQKRLIEIFFRVKRSIQAYEAKGDGVERNWSSCKGYSRTFSRTEPNFCWYRDICEAVDKDSAQRAEKSLFKINENPWRPW